MSSKDSSKSVMVISRPPDFTEQHVGHYERNFITAVRAMEDFMLKPEHLGNLNLPRFFFCFEAKKPAKFKFEFNFKFFSWS